MKQPYEISSDFFKKMTSSGWYFERDVLLEKLPPHLEELPDLVKKFLREIWYISVAKDMYIPVEYEMFIIDKKIRNFGFKEGRDILIDELGRIYEIPDSGDIYYVGGKFYEGLYNLIYSRGESYIVSDTGELFKETQEGIMSANMNIEDIE